MSGSNIVYTTGLGEICTGCRRPVAQCHCKKQNGAPARGPQAIRVARSTQGRGGKVVTTITGLGLPAADLEKLARELKQRCGSGGALRDGVLEIQGEHRDTIVAELIKRGFPAKRAGG